MRCFFKSYGFLLAFALLSFSGPARAACDITGPTEVCPTQGAVTYDVSNWSGYNESWEVLPAGSDMGITRDPSNPDRAFINFSNTFSGCFKVVTVKFNYFNAAQGGWQNCSLTVVLYKDEGAMSNISGPATVSPSQGWINELPEVIYSVNDFSCANFGNYVWTTPSGWTITSGQGTHEIHVQPEMGSACDGQIQVFYSKGPCEKIKTKSVSRTALSQGIITNFFNSQGAGTALEICPDDDLKVVASPSTFCQTSTNIFFSFYESNALWQNINEYNAWLNPTQYDALGGLSFLDVREFLRTYYPSVTISAGNYYKVKIAVGGTWNERTYLFHVNNPLAVAAPTGLSSNVLNPGAAPFKMVDVIWDGSVNKSYEINYEYHDPMAPPFPCTFPPLYTVKMRTPCAAPTQHPLLSNKVYVTLNGLHKDYCFRFRVRECGCGPWSAWSTPMQLYKKGATGIENNPETGKVLVESYPSPFSESISLNITLPSASMISVKVFDVTGKEVKSIPGAEYGAGPNAIEINTSGFSPGLYTFLVNTGHGVFSHKTICNK